MVRQGLAAEEAARVTSNVEQSATKRIAVFGEGDSGQQVRAQFGKPQPGNNASGLSFCCHLDGMLRSK